MCFHTTPSPTIVLAYSDADWIAYKDSYCSTTRYVVFFGSKLIAWHSKKQPIVSKSSAEVEYRTLTYIVAETVWINKLPYNLGVFLSTLVRLYSNNLDVTCMSVNPVQHDHSKYIVVDYYFVRKWIVDGDLIIHYVSIRL